MADGSKPTLKVVDPDGSGDEPADRQPNLLTEVGGTGLKNYGGTITEEFLRSLDGLQGVKTYAEMRDNSPIIGAILYVFNMLIRQVKWEVEAASDSAEDRAMANLLSECIDDMEHTWQDFMSEVLSMLVFGWSAHELVFKYRRGYHPEDPRISSRYDDGKVGLRKLPIRAQETLSRWHLGKDEQGNDDPDTVVAMEQQLPTAGGIRIIPMKKLVLFRPASYKNSPMGRSLLRNAYKSYYFARKIEEIEAIGIERDLAGLPVALAPARVMSTQATADERAIFARLQTIVKTIRNDQNAGVVFPSDRTKDGHLLYELKLLSTGGSRTFNTNEVILRHETAQARSVLAEFLFLGQTAVGSFALATSKTGMFGRAMHALLDSICETFNRSVVPMLMRLNGERLKSTPRLTHGDVEIPDLAQLAAYVGSLAAAGMPLFPDPALEAHLRTVGSLPEASLDVGREVGDTTGETDDDPTDSTELGAEDPARVQAEQAAAQRRQQASDPGGAASDDDAEKGKTADEKDKKPEDEDEEEK